ncbi:MAG: hypothetical protein ACHQQQ_01300 [Bacteroidota bacterium]
MIWCADFSSGTGVKGGDRGVGWSTPSLVPPLRWWNAGMTLCVER